jgi:ADP-heptose:LPS heptosyltransferase
MSQLISRKLRLFWRKIKRLLEWLIYGTFDKIVLLRQKKVPDKPTVAIVQMKLLGDFILWLPYAKALVRDSELLQRNVILIINSAVLPLAELLFPSCTLIAINRISFIRNFSERKKLLEKLRNLGTSITYIDTQPRDAIIEDAIVHALGAPAWGFDSTYPDRPWLDWRLNRRLYTRLLPSINGVHQSIRHRAFLEAIDAQGQHLEPIPSLVFGAARPLLSSYFVIAPGASRTEKHWPTKYFIEIAKRILINFPEWKLVVLGMQSERAIGDKIAQVIGSVVQNYAGETNLLEFVNWIAHAELVIGNDSAACHIAAACGIASFPIVGGGHPGWFFPYPPDSAVKRSPNAITEPMSCFGCDWICHYDVAKHEPFPCIARITPDRVWKEISTALALNETQIIGAPSATHPTNF